MGTPVAPKPAKSFIAFLVSFLTLLASVEAELVATLGEIYFWGTVAAWQEAKFYAAEAGARLWHGYWSSQAIEFFSTTRAIYVEQLRRLGDLSSIH